MKGIGTYLVWVLVIGGLLWGYDGIANQDLVSNVFGMGTENIIDIIIGVCAVLAGVMLLGGNLIIKEK